MYPGSTAIQNLFDQLFNTDPAGGQEVVEQRPNNKIILQFTSVQSGRGINSGRITSPRELNEGHISRPADGASVLRLLVIKYKSQFKTQPFTRRCFFVIEQNLARRAKLILHPAGGEILTLSIFGTVPNRSPITSDPAAQLIYQVPPIGLSVTRTSRNSSKKSTGVASNEDIPLTQNSFNPFGPPEPVRAAGKFSVMHRPGSTESPATSVQVNILILSMYIRPRATIYLMVGYYHPT